MGPSIICKIPRPCHIIDYCAYSDVSFGVGVGITIGEYWHAWRLLPGWKSQGWEIGWAEAVRFELLIQTLLTASSLGENFKVFGDNRGVIKGWWKGRSRNKLTNEIFQRINDLTSSYQCNVYTRYVPSKDNPADDPSQGIYPPSRYLLPATQIPPNLQLFIVDFDVPPHQSELVAS